jgi:hypothetical protein
MSLGATGRRRLGGRAGVVGLAVIAAAGLFAATPAGAQAPRESVYVHSAARGELGGGRLTLHGVNRRVTWTHNSGRFGVMAVRRMHGWSSRACAPRRPARSTWRATTAVTS